MLSSLTLGPPGDTTIDSVSRRLLVVTADETDDPVGIIIETDVIEASIELQEHKEQNRGVLLVLARIRLATDRSYFTAEGEGYGATHC